MSEYAPSFFSVRVTNSFRAELGKGGYDKVHLCGLAATGSRWRYARFAQRHRRCTPGAGPPTHYGISLRPTTSRGTPRIEHANDSVRSCNHANSL